MILLTLATEITRFLKENDHHLFLQNMEGIFHRSYWYESCDVGFVIVRKAD